MPRCRCCATRSTVSDDASRRTVPRSDQDPRERILVKRAMVAGEIRHIAPGQNLICFRRPAADHLVARPLVPADVEGALRGIEGYLVVILDMIADPPGERLMVAGPFVEVEIGGDDDAGGRAEIAVLVAPVPDMACEIVLVVAAEARLV